jgi:hypothetical protein
VGSGEHWGGGPPDAATSRAYWRLLDAAVRRADAHFHLDSDAARELGAVLDEAAVAYASSLTPAAKQIIAKRAREP